MATLKFRIKGLTPLLCNNPASMGKSNGVTKKKEYVAEDEAYKSAYQMEDGSFGFPAIGIRGSILKGCTGLKSGKFALTSLLSHIQVFGSDGGDLMQILDEDGNPATDYLIDSRRAVVQRNGIIRNRAKFPRWKVEFMIEFDEAYVPRAEETFTDVLENAGKKVGLGDYRPACKGWFGQYTVEEI